MTKFLSKKIVKSLGVAALVSLASVADAQFSWSPAGPVYTAGRIRNMVVDKTNNSLLYVGSTSSGVFTSTNSGQSWAPIDDQGSVRNISYMAQASNGDIYAGTGEGFLRVSQKSKALRGTGLYRKSGSDLVLVTDSAITGSIINKVACHPINSAMIALATNKGILLSTNSGVSFVPAPGTPSMVGQDVKFDSNGILYCSVGYENTSSGTGTTTVWKASSSDIGSATFSNITPTSIAVTNQNYGRIELAIAPSNPAVIYASCAGKYTSSATASLAGLFVSYNAGQTWGTILVGSSQLDPLFNGTTRASGDYAHCLTVDPANPNVLYMGGYYLYNFYRTGGTDSNPIGYWIKRGNPGAINTQLYVHENIHDIKLIGSNVYVITDAGIYRSVDNMLSWQPYYKNLVTGQFNSVSIERYPISSTTNGSVTPNIGFTGGTGGNGNIYFRGALAGSTLNVNTEVSSIGGDVFASEFSKLLPSAAYMTGGNGPLYRTTNVGTSEPDVTPVVANTSNQTVANVHGSSFSVTGTPFKLWEYYGQQYQGGILTNPDKLFFYNDTSFALSTVPSLTTSTNFTFSVGRPQKKAAIDYIVIRATNVKVEINPNTISIPTFSVVDTKTIAIQMNTFVVPNSGTLAAPITTVDGFVGTYSLNKVILNSTSQLDEIQVALAGPLFTAQPSSVPSVTNIESYIRLKATVYYKYNANDSLSILYDNISTMGTTYSVTTPVALKWTQPATSTLNATSNPLQKFNLKNSARLALAYGKDVYVSKAPLDLNTPLSLVKVSANKALTTNSLGVALSAYSETVAVTGTASILEWSKSGTELYYATDQNYLYRVSFIGDILDSTAKSYNGKLHTGIFTYSMTTAGIYTVSQFGNPNPRCTYRTTFLGNFPKKITSISISPNDSVMMLTFNDASATGTTAMVNTVNCRKSDFSNIGFVNKTGSIALGSGTATPNFQTVYCSLMEKSDPKKVFIGTDRGVYYTSDISVAAPTWSLANNGQLPRVQIFDIKQQTMAPWECYNSGQIYVATNGRGIWINKEYYNQTVIGVEEIVKSAHATNLKLFPNPSNDKVNISFRGYDNETITVQLLDINGRVVKAENFGKINNGDVNVTMDVAELSTGMYIVNVHSDSGIRRVSKLIVTK